MVFTRAMTVLALLSASLLPCSAVRCLMCASYAGSNPGCETATISRGVASRMCPGSLPWTDGCKVMVFKVPRIGDIWTRGCCGGIFPKCQNSSSHFVVGASCMTDDCNTMDPTKGRRLIRDLLDDGTAGEAVDEEEQFKHLLE
eukprot:GFUD01081190.1.p1 GENE.GFUD01081190.1~~GFUD01081190.1.p1  ORF type:complete len:143 (-),score=36.38 GFUD01081190.1:162-590(-)